jgi:hypothetical protein
MIVLDEFLTQGSYRDGKTAGPELTLPFCYEKEGSVKLS